MMSRMRFSMGLMVLALFVLQSCRETPIDPWDPGNGGDYNLAGITNARVRFARSLSHTNTLYFGNSTSRFVLAATTRGGEIVGAGAGFVAGFASAAALLAGEPTW